MKCPSCDADMTPLDEQGERQECPDCRYVWPPKQGTRSAPTGRQQWLQMLAKLEQESKP